MVNKRITVVAVLGALGLAPFVSPSQAVGAGSPAPSVVARATVAPPLVQGLAIDQSGHYVDGVAVQATRDDGSPAASDITYASVREDGPQHGYFYLEVGSRGTYTLKLSKAGYVTTTYGPVEVKRQRARIALGDILVTKVLPASATAAGLDDHRIAAGHKAEVRVKVSSTATKKPAGEVEVREGRRVVGSAVLRPGAKGQVTITLRKLDAGTHRLKAHFFGSSSVKASTSKAFTLTVAKARHRPGAW